MKLNNYLINGKALGFTKGENPSQIIPEVLRSYLPIKPSSCMLTGKPILTDTKILLLDGDPSNILFSNILVVTSEVTINSSFIHEVVVKSGKYSVKFWSLDDFPLLSQNNKKIILKYFYETAEENPFQIFLDLVYLGVKGLVFTSVELNESFTESHQSFTETHSCHYQDVIKYRIMNPTNIVSPLGI